MALALGLLVALAAALRLYGLDRWSLWLDETVQYHYAITPLGELYEAMDAYAAPLSLELSRALVWLGLDHTGGMLRLPSAIIGVATVVLVYFLATELFCRRVAWLSALVACVMPVLIVYSQEYRPYSLLIFLTTLSSWSLAAALRTNAPIWWCAFVGATILDVYTHFVALPALAGLIVFASGYILLEVLHKKPVKSTIMSALLAFTIIGIAYIPALPRLARLFVFEAKEMGSGGPGWDVFRLAYVEYPGFGGWLGVAAAAVALLGIAWSAFRFPRAGLFFLGTLGVSAALFHDHAHVVTSPRYISFVMPAFAVAIGAGLAVITFAVELLMVRAGYTTRQASIVAVPLLTILLLLASINPLSQVFAANPKQLPVDLREGYDYVHHGTHANDLFLRASTTEGGRVGWFGLYDSFFLREGAWPEVPVIGSIDDTSFLEELSRYRLLGGRLWVLMTVSDDEQPMVKGRGGPDFSVQCFRRICAIESRLADRSMLDQLTAFFDHYGDLDSQIFDKPERAVRAAVKDGSG